MQQVSPNQFLKTVALLAALIGIGYTIDLGYYQFFAPKQEAARRKEFEQSRAFNTGMMQELDQMEREYKTNKDPEAKAAIASEFRHRVSGYNLNDPAVSEDLRQFAKEIK